MNTYSVKQPDLYYFEAIKMASQDYRVRTAQGKPGKPGKRDFLKKSGKTWKTQGIF